MAKKINFNPISGKFDYTEDISGKANVNQTMYIGTTAVTIDRASATLNLAGIGTLGTGVVTSTTDAVGVAQTIGSSLINSSVAAAAAQQFSPVFELEGQGWKTTAAAGSQEVKWGLQTRPVQGAANPTSVLDFLSSINGGAYTSKASLSSAGVFSAVRIEAPRYINWDEFNTKIGFDAGKNTVAGAAINIFIGYEAGMSASAGGTNTADGNIIIGYLTFYYNTSGANNVVIGTNALQLNTTGSYNLAFGHSSLLNNQTGSNNVGLGNYAGAYETSSNAFYVNNQNRTDLAGDKAKSILYGVMNADQTLQKLQVNANLKIGAGDVRATTVGTRVFDIFDGTAPAGTLANGVSLYSTAGELRVMDAAGNATLLSPHDKKTNEWIYDSIDNNGKRLRIDMEKMMKAINEKFGWDFVNEFCV